MADGRQYLIAVGSPRTPGLPPLGRVEHDVDRITAIFCSLAQGYERVLTDKISSAAPAHVIHDAIYDWFTDQDRRSSDIVLFYFAGHGGDAGRAGNYYLFTSDTNESQLSKTAINLAAFLQELYEGAGERPQNVLLILDACYSAKGGAQSVAALSRIRESGFLREGAGLWVVASADPLTEAGDGTFVHALEAVLSDPAWAPRGGARFLNPIDVMVHAVNERFTRDELAQQAEGDVFGVRAEPCFIRNPNYTDKLDGTPLLDESHWDPKARGVEGLASTGWYFTGRQRVLRELTAWLQAPGSDQKARVVIGKPGSGKSAVLGRLVMSAHSDKRAEMIAAGILDPADGTAPAEGSIGAYVHARGLSTDSIADTVARQLSSPDTTLDAVLRCLRTAKGPIGIVIDALDEAANPPETEAKLLRTLAESSAIRLIIGTRQRGAEAPLAGAAVIIDLDTPAIYFNSSDVVAYAFRRLLESDPPTAYRDPTKHRDARNIAEFVAERAGFSFLLARLVTRELASAEMSIDTSERGWKTRVRVPENLAQAFEHDLLRFDRGERQRIINLLVPLAYARGKGLPQKNIWVAVASEASGQAYTNADIRDIKSTVGYYIVQDVERGQVVYRLFHQEFADYIMQLTRDEDVERSFVRGLRRATFERGRVAGWDQLQDPYTLHYLAAHAAAGGLLDEIIQEPAFLVYAPPEAVLPHLTRVASRTTRRLAEAYRRVSHHMRAPQTQERITYLHLAALQAGLEEFAAGLASRRQFYSWHAQWANWVKAVPGEVVIESGGVVSAIAALEVTPDLTTVALGVKGTVELRGLPDRTLIARSAAFEEELGHLSLIDAGDQHWIAGVWTHRGTVTVRVLEYPTCQLYAEALVAQVRNGQPALATVCAGVVSGNAMMAIATGDQKLSLWGIPSLGRVQSVGVGHHTPVRCMGFSVADRGPLLVAAFDACGSGRWCPEGILTRAWTIPSLVAVADHYYESRGSSRSMAIFTAGGEQFAMIGYIANDGFEILDMSLRTVYEQHNGAFELSGMFPQVSSGNVLLCGQRYGKFCFSEVTNHGNGRVTCTVYHTRTEISGNLITRPVRVHGRVGLASVDDGTRIRLWDIDEMISSRTIDAHSYAISEESSFAPEIDTISAVVADKESSTIIVGAQTGRMSAFDAATGALRWVHSSELNIVAAALTTVEGRRVVVLASRRGELGVFDIETGALVGPTMSAGKWISSISTQIVDGVPLCFAAAELDSRKHGISVFDLRTYEEKKIVPNRFEFQPSEHLRITGFEDKSLEAVCVVLDNGKSSVLMAGPWSFVEKSMWPPHPLGSLASIKLEMQEKLGNTYVKSLTAGRLAGKSVAAAGNERGLLAVWDLKTNTLLHRVESAHEGPIAALAIADWFGSGALISGGSGYIRVWSASLQPILEIDFEARIVGVAPLNENQFVVATEKGFVVVAVREPLGFHRTSPTPTPAPRR